MAHFFSFLPQAHTLMEMSSSPTAPPQCNKKKRKRAITKLQSATIAKPSGIASLASAELCSATVGSDDSKVPTHSCQWLVHETKQGTWYIPLVAMEERIALVRYVEEHYLKWCRQWKISISPSLIHNGGTGLVAHQKIPKHKTLWYFAFAFLHLPLPK